MFKRSKEEKHSKKKCLDFSSKLTTRNFFFLESYQSFAEESSGNHGWQKQQQLSRDTLKLHFSLETFFLQRFHAVV